MPISRPLALRQTYLESAARAQIDLDTARVHPLGPCIQRITQIGWVVSALKTRSRRALNSRIACTSRSKGWSRSTFAVRHRVDLLRVVPARRAAARSVRGLHFFEHRIQPSIAAFERGRGSRQYQAVAASSGLDSTPPAAG